MARGFTALFLEVEAGRRPRAHLTPFLSPMLYARLTNVRVLTGAPGDVLLVRVVSLAAGGCDVVAVVRRGRRCGAISLRMVRTPAGWVVDEIAMPEFGPLPPPPYPVPASEPDETDDMSLIPLPVRDPAAAGGSRTDWFRPPITG